MANDKLAAFAVLPTEMVRGAITTTRDALSAPVLANSIVRQTMAETDGTPFRANQGNVADSCGALSVATLGAAAGMAQRPTRMGSKSAITAV